MKADDKVAILQASPAISVLESTRKDFEALLSSAYSSNEEGSKYAEKFVRKSRNRKISKRDALSRKREVMELSEVTPGLKSAEGEGSFTNSAFWYEKENGSNSSTPTRYSCEPSSNRGKRVKSRSIQKSDSGSSVERKVILHKDGLRSSEENASEEDIENERIELEKAQAIEPTSPSVSSSASESFHSRKSFVASQSRSLRSLGQRSSTECSMSFSPAKSDRHQRRGANEKDQTKQKCLQFKCNTLKVMVHHTDRLILEQPQAQPMVAVHAVNADTGQYILHKSAAVQPQFTGAWISKELSSTVVPTWNQDLVFELDSGSSLNAVLLLFQLVNEQNLLAWGFFRPVSRFGVKHTDKKVQLQLYRVPIRRLYHQSSKPNVTDIFSWYQSSRKEKYPATLYVTVISASSLSNRAENMSPYKKTLASDAKPPLLLGRLKGQPFKFPTRRSFTLGSKAGALMARYSPDGSSLAVALTNGDIFVLLSGTSETAHLKGHQGNVYDLDWSFVVEAAFILLSCGADSTARLWDKSSCLVLLPHPAYVYSARFLNEARIATGCYDQLIRLWDFNLSGVTLLNTYTQHTAPVNCLCWDPQGLLYSGDAIGCLRVWRVGLDHLQFDRSRFVFIILDILSIIKMCIKIKNARVLNESSEGHRNQISVNWLCLHPSGTRLVIHYRDNNLHLLEIKSGIKLLSYCGIYNPR